MRPLLIIFLSCLALISCKKEQAQQAEAPEVPVVPVAQRDVAITSEFVGQTYGGSDIELRARVQGWVTGIHFQEGSEVKKGQLLYSIDPLQYETKVGVSKSELAEADANLAKAKSDLDRIRPLAASNAVSQRELVAAEAQYSAAIARKQAYESNLVNAKIELGYTNVLSPLKGVIGITKVQVGDLVGTINSSSLNTVSDITTFKVRFSITEREYLQFNKRVSSGEKINREAQMLLTDGSLYPQKGNIDLINREIDASTGTLMVEATFPNPDKLIRPGQFARIRFVSQTLKGALLVPQLAVTELQGTFQVYIIDKENKIQIRSVEAGERYGSEWIISKGLSPGDRVALIGNLALRVNSVVKPVAVKSDTTKI